MVQIHAGADLFAFTFICSFIFVNFLGCLERRFWPLSLFFSTSEFSSLDLRFFLFLSFNGTHFELPFVLLPPQKAPVLFYLSTPSYTP